MLKKIKEEVLWLHRFSRFEEAQEKIGQWIEVEHNKLYVHSELGYMSPEDFEMGIWVVLRKSIVA